MTKTTEFLKYPASDKPSVKLPSDLHIDADIFWYRTHCQIIDINNPQTTMSSLIFVVLSEIDEFIVHYRGSHDLTQFYTFEPVTKFAKEYSAFYQFCAIYKDKHLIGFWDCPIAWLQNHTLLDSVKLQKSAIKQWFHPIPEQFFPKVVSDKVPDELVEAGLVPDPVEIEASEPVSPPLPSPSKVSKKQPKKSKPQKKTKKIKPIHKSKPHQATKSKGKSSHKHSRK